MKQAGTFVADRALAQHSAALIRPGPDDADLIGALTQATVRLARSLRAGLARLCGGEPPDVAIDPPRVLAFADFAREGLCAYSVYTLATGAEAGPENGPETGQDMAHSSHAIGAIDAEAVLRLVDRAFGGPGEAPRPMPREMPLSADLMVQRIETILAAHLAGALGAVQPVIRPLRRDYDLAQITPFAPTTRLAVLDIAVSEGARAPWPIRLALPVALLPALTGMAPTAAARRPGEAMPHDPAASPFAEMPLTLTALLVDTPMALQVVSRLEPGQVLTLPIARQVPLLVGDPRPGARLAIAAGTIGAVDDRVAIQITQLA